MSQNGASAPSTPPVPVPAAAGQDARPELVVGAAFAGGLALALLFRRLGR